MQVDRILPVDVHLMPVGQLRNDGLQALAGVLRLAGAVMEEAEVALYAMRCADQTVEVLGAEPSEFWHIVEFGECAHGLGRFKDHRFPNSEAWMRTAFEDNHTQPVACEHGCQCGPAYAGTDYGNIECIERLGHERKPASHP
jgi:hypothetical protein